MRPVNTVVSAFHYRALLAMRDIGRALNRKDDAAKWEKLADETKKTINESLFDAGQGRYVDGIGSTHSSLHANMFPLAFGIVPEERKNSVIKFMETRGMACSVYGAQYLLDGLYGAGAGDYALSLLTATNDRSWYHMIEAGSTISMEAWDNKFKENQDWNHAWGAVPANAIPRLVMGIQPIEPAYARFRVRPQLGALKFASLICPSVRGNIRLDVTQDKKWSARLSVPANTVAEVWVPTTDIGRVIESRRPVKQAEWIKFLRTENGCLVFEVPAGSYSFTVEQ
jgi:hypothetical protein